MPDGYFRARREIAGRAAAEAHRPETEPVLTAVGLIGDHHFELIEPDEPGAVAATVCIQRGSTGEIVGGVAWRERRPEKWRRLAVIGSPAWFGRDHICEAATHRQLIRIAANPAHVVAGGGHAACPVDPLAPAALAAIRAAIDAGAQGVAPLTREAWGLWHRLAAQEIEQYRIPTRQLWTWEAK